MSLPDSPESCLCAAENKIECLEESTRAMKIHRNSLVPISRLPTEILCIIFSLLPSFEVLDLESSPYILSSPVSHVCHRWREISHDMSCFWSRIDFNKLTTAGVAEVLARAKTAPLYLEAEVGIQKCETEKFEAFEGQIKAHIYHTCHLSITSTPYRLVQTFEHLISSAPSLERLSITKRKHYPESSLVIVPDNLFDGIVPKLTYLRLERCGIGWQSPLLKGLRDLNLIWFQKRARIPINAWLDALNQMTQLERLVLHGHIPIRSVELSGEPMITAVLSSLTKLIIYATARDCAVVLAHLVLPALTRLCVDAYTEESIDVEHLIPFVAQHAHGHQDTEALQSLFVEGNEERANITAWTTPRRDADDGLRSSVDLPDEVRPARVEIRIMHCGTYVQLHDAVLTALPLNSISSLSVKGCKSLREEVWRGHAPKWHKLERIRLYSSAVPAFRNLFYGRSPHATNLLPSLEELVLVDVSLNAQRVYYLCDMLFVRVELEIPLRTLDLRTCTVPDCAVQFLGEILLDVKGPMKRESGGKGQARTVTDVISEKVENDGEDDGEDDGFDDKLSFHASWVTDDDDFGGSNSDDDASDDSDDDSDDE